jgi:hypothetical protein
MKPEREPKIGTTGYYFLARNTNFLGVLLSFNATGCKRAPIG